jgi:uncharacterized phage protein gp47/JayE
MAIPTIPTITEIKNRIIADIESEINQTTPSLPKSFNRVLAGAIAGVVMLLYQAITWVYKQIFPDTADTAALKLLGALVGVTQLAAEFAVLECDVPGVVGETVSTGLLFRSTNNTVYKVTTGGTIGVSGEASVTMTAQTSGEIGNLANGSILSIINPDPNLDGTATVTATTTSGDDAETDDSLRVRVSNAYKKRRTGGSPADYESWGLETPNFDWISPVADLLIPGKVLLYGKVDNQTDGIPTSDQLAELESYVRYDPVTGKANRCPFTDDVEAVAISRFLFDITIYIQDGTVAIQESIETAVTEYVENRQPYNAGVSLTRSDTISESGISNVASDVADAAGAAITSVILAQTDSGLILSSYQLFGGEFGKVNSITFEVVS